MPKTHSVSTLTLEAREGIGTTKSQGLRAAGKVPGVVYGHGSSTPVIVDAKQLTEVLLAGNRSHIIKATVAGKPDSVLIRKIDVHPISRKPLSVDFQRVSQGEAITSNVTVVVKGVPRGVRDEGAVMDIVTHALEIKGPAQSIPDHLEVDVTEMGAHTHLTASQVELPKGFTLLTPGHTTVVSVEVNRAAAVIATADAAGAATASAEAQPADAPTAS